MFEKIFGAIGIIGKIIKWILLVVFLGLGIFLLIFSIIVLTRGDGWSGLNDPEKVGTIFALVIGVICGYSSKLSLFLYKVIHLICHYLSII